MSLKVSSTQFSAKIKAFQDKVNEKVLTIFRASAQDVASEMTTTVGNGGNMRIDTGYLRASALASLSKLPPINPNGRPAKDAKPNSYRYDAEAINLVIAKAELKDTISIGFTAAYARPREYHDGFVRLAAQNWKTIVSNNVDKVK